MYAELSEMSQENRIHYFLRADKKLKINISTSLSIKRKKKTKPNPSRGDGTYTNKNHTFQNTSLMTKLQYRDQVSFFVSAFISVSTWQEEKALPLCSVP